MIEEINESHDQACPGMNSLSQARPCEHRICFHQKVRMDLSKAASKCLNERSEGVFDAS